MPDRRPEDDARDPPPPDVAALRAHDELFRTVFEQASDHAIVVMDLARTITAWNPAASRITGWSPDEAIGQPADLIFTAEDRAAGVPQKEVGGAARDGKAIDERWHLRRNGERFWGSGTMNALHDPAGRVSGFVKLFRDATVQHDEAQTLAFLRRLTDAVIREADPEAIIEIMLRLLGEHLRATRVLVAEPSLDGEFVHIVQTWSPGVPPLAGTHRLADYGEVLLANYRAGRVHVVRDAEKEYPPEALTNQRRIDTMAVIDVPVLVGDRLRALFVVHQKTARNWTDGEVALVRQVADRLVAEVARARAAREQQDLSRRLAQQSRLFEGIAGTTPDFIYVFDRQGRFLYANRRLLEVWGRTAEEAFGRSLPELGYPDWHAEMHHREIEQVIRTKQPIKGKVPFTGGSGIGGVYEYIFTPVLGPDGEVEVIAGTTRDVSDVEHSLEAEQAARNEAERQGRMKDEFLATLSHELRTPLNAIVGWVQILKSSMDDPQSVQEGLAVIDRNARAQTQIIGDILDMSRIISGKMRLDVQPVDLAQLVRAGVDTVQPAADGKGVRLTAVIDPLAGPVMGDPNRLHQVFWNLLTNAVKFTPRGGRVQVVLARVKSHVEIDVVDTGEGIAPQFLPHVFDRFRQADASTTRQHGGLGLGLSIVRQLVEMHGGSVRAESVGPGQGARFVVALPVTIASAPSPDVELPRQRERQQPSPGERAVACDQLAGVSVIAVDDEPDGRTVLRRLLSECGATVQTAGSARDALALVRAGPPTVLISDIGMPGEDGYSLIRQVRALPAERGGATPAIALTAYARSADRIKAIEAGFQAHLAKPVEPAELIVTVAMMAKRNTPAE